MTIKLQENIVMQCSVDEIIHPTKDEEALRQDKSIEIWTMFRTYIKKGTHYEPRICTGMALPLSVGDEITMTGDLVDTNKYGIQFQFSAIKKQIPTERNGVIAFLVKNINGVGKSTAERIVDALGIDLVEKIKKDKSVLESINGISTKKATMIKDQIDALGSSLDDLQFFAKTGLGSARIAAIKSTYSELNKDKKTKIDVVKLIKSNPYQLITDVKGIGFKMADSVALKIGIAKDDPNRIASGLQYVLKERCKILLI